MHDVLSHYTVTASGVLHAPTGAVGGRICETLDLKIEFHQNYVIVIGSTATFII